GAESRPRPRCSRTAAARAATRGADSAQYPAEVAQHLALELLQGLAERHAEGLVPRAAGGERSVVLHQAVEAVAADQIVGHEERDLIGRQRALAQVAHREAARRAEGLQI